ncbi:MAG TPA: NapC/NirT family cytochrome c [Anaerolineales bacterium]|nr:NapC/NirT family cytochrome c [Anaerolineales bacterium]
MGLFKKRGTRKRWLKLTIDLSKKEHRLILALSSLGVLVVLVGLLIGGIKAYDYTESSQFCGTTCHVMDPQYIRYLQSPHANVDCAQCHIGPGASFFVRSKIDGLRQVYATIFDTFHRPILSPVYNLRPARETCETCHSPTTFKDNIVKIIQHYDNDADNTPIETTLILKMGGNQGSLLADAKITQGIHWHVSSEVYYIATDPQRQDMAWVGVRQDDGSMKDFYSPELTGADLTKFKQEAEAAGQLRLMDCIDCHNRTAHYIPYPDQAVDQAIAAGLISRQIPNIRNRAVELMSASYDSIDDANAAFDGLLSEYSNTTNGKVASNPSLENVDSFLVAEAVETLKTIYSQVTFPEMKTDWTTNPNNERHTPSLGCFRCHNDQLVADLELSTGSETETVTSECNLCHTVPITGRGSELLFEAPVIVGSAPESHKDYSWTITHGSITQDEIQDCYLCHGQGFCNNGACHNLNHPADMLFTHDDEYRKVGEQVCYTCHQDITCLKCHPGGVVDNP